MKIKPLIKTHWVASQNPMMVSLSGLKRIVFSPPAELLSFDFVSEASAEVTLEPLTQKKPEVVNDHSDVRRFGVHKTTTTRNFLSALFSGDEASPAGVPTAAMKALSQSLEFHFEDGQRVLASGIFHRADFPVFLNPKYYAQDSSCNWERALSALSENHFKALKVTAHRKRGEDFKKTWLIVLEIVAWALQRQRQMADLEVIWCEKYEADAPYDSLSRAGHRLDEVEFGSAAPLAATVMTKSGLGWMRLWAGKDPHVPVGTVRFHSADALAELESFFWGTHPNPFAEGLEIDDQERKALAASERALHWQPTFVSEAKAADDFLKSLAKVEHTIGRNQIYFANHSLVAGTEFTPRVQVRENEGALEMAVSFALGSGPLDHLNFPTSLKTVFAPFLGGIGDFFQLDRKESASRQSQYRANDLLFLRHQGLAIFCLFELVNWVLKRPLSSGEEIEFVEDLTLPEADQQFEKVVRYLENSIPALLGKTGVQFRALVSSRVQNYFLEFVEKIFDVLVNDRSLVFAGDRIVEVKNVQTEVLPVVRFLILHFIESSAGKFLTRTQAPLGERFIESLRQWTVPRIVPRSDELKTEDSVLWVDIGRFEKYSVSLLFELGDLGIHVDLNGSSLFSQENPFEFVFSLKDAEQKDDVNWFDLHPQIFFNGTQVSTEEVKINFGQGQVGFIEYQGLIYRIDKKQLPSLKSLQRFWNKIKGFKQALPNGKFGEKVYQLPKSQALDLLMLKAQGFAVNVEGEWKRIFDYFENGLGVEKIELPEALEKMLLTHQREGVQWLHDLYELKLGAILADEMGLGKTFQILSFLVSLHEKQNLKRSLIVVPTSLVYNWVDEKKKFAPDLPLRVFHSGDQKELNALFAKDEPMVLVTTYGLLLENPDFFQTQVWNILTFDEAQNLKNITSQRSVSARKLNARFKVCVTGTPMENNYLEFFSLCDLVVPGSLGNIDAFRREYFNREVRSESLRELRLVSKPLVLRRTKSQIKLALPQKTISRVCLPFGERQKEIYKKMAMAFSRQVEELIQDQGEKKAQFAMFAALMRLRQICSDPAAVPGVIFNERPVKVEHFLDAVKEHIENGESVVVFTQFLSTLSRIRRELAAIEVPAYTLQGSVSAKERVRLITAFQESPDPGVMLMTLKTGGVGLNLTKASVVYHMEPWWNPAVENQATDRAHRMGQTKDVKVFNLLIEGSLEERIADLKLKKQDSFDRLFGVDEQIEESGFEGSAALSRDDFIYLLK